LTGCKVALVSTVLCLLRRHVQDLATGGTPAEVALMLDALALVSHLAGFAHTQLQLVAGKKQADRIAGLLAPGGSSTVKHVRAMSRWQGEGLVAAVVEAAKGSFAVCKSMLQVFRLIPDERLIPVCLSDV
jgi:hypothetical protein